MMIYFFLFATEEGPLPVTEFYTEFLIKLFFLFMALIPTFKLFTQSL